jgi:hypothetical protein
MLPRGILQVEHNQHTHIIAKALPLRSDPKPTLSFLAFRAIQAISLLRHNTMFSGLDSLIAC